MKTCLALCIILGLVAPLHAQRATPQATPPPLPPGPLLNPAPASAKWVVTMEAPRTGAPRPEDKAANRSDKRLTVTKTGDLREEELVDGAGARTVTWTVGKYRVTLRPGKEVAPMVTMTSGAKDKQNSARVDFPGFEWLSEKKYAGMAKVLGKDCIIFKDMTASAPGSTDSKEPVVGAVASIELQTRLPVALVLGEEKRVYQFLPPPQGMLVPPAAVQTAVDQWQKHLDKAARLPLKPL